MSETNSLSSNTQIEEGNQLHSVSRKSSSGQMHRKQQKGCDPCDRLRKEDNKRERDMPKIGVVRIMLGKGLGLTLPDRHAQADCDARVESDSHGVGFGIGSLLVQMGF